MNKGIWLMAALAAACGGTTTSPGGATGSGTVSGGTGEVGALNFKVNDAASFTFSGQACSGSDQQTGAIIILSSATGVCASAQNASAKTPDGQYLVLTLVNDGTSAQPALTTGTFQVHIGPPMPEFLGDMEQSTNGCVKGNPAYTTGSGSITISSIDANGISGSYSLTFVESANIANAAGTLNGTFTAPNCAVPHSFICSAGSAAC